MEVLLIVTTLFVALLSSVLSGLAGGGGAFIMAPYWLIIGLTPAEGAAVGGFMALGIGIGSLAAFKGTEYAPKNKKFLWILIVLAFVLSIIGPLFLPHISTDVFKPILAILTIVAIPLLFMSPRNISLDTRSKTIGFILLVLCLVGYSFVNSSAFAIFVTVILLQVFKMSVLESTVIRRAVGLVQSAVIFVVLAITGHFIWFYAVAGIIGGYIGSYLGTRMAIKKGERFAKYALAAGGILGAVALIVL